MRVVPVDHRMPLFGLKSWILVNGSPIIVDSGTSSGTAKNIEVTLEANGSSLEDVKLLVVTHAHSDHVGGVKALKEAGGFSVAAHRDEATDVEKQTGVKVDVLLSDGDEVGQGVKIIHLPGHTRGSIGILTGGTLITGDALRGKKGGLNPPMSFVTYNMPEARRSLLKLRSLEFEAITVSHGPDVPSGGKKALERLLAEMKLK